MNCLVTLLKLTVHIFFLLFFFDKRKKIQCSEDSSDVTRLLQFTPTRDVTNTHTSTHSFS